MFLHSFFTLLWSNFTREEVSFFLVLPHLMCENSNMSGQILTHNWKKAKQTCQCVITLTGNSNRPFMSLIYCNHHFLTIKYIHTSGRCIHIEAINSIKIFTIRWLSVIQSNANILTISYDIKQLGTSHYMLAHIVRNHSQYSLPQSIIWSKTWRRIRAKFTSL